MTAATSGPVVRTHGNAYEIFILTLTLLSLLIMVLLLLPLSEPVHVTLTFYDNLICLVFLIDVAYNLKGSHPRSEYFIKRRGWLDLLGSIPTLGILRFTALFRLARLSRLARIARAYEGASQKDLVRDVIRNRGQYALFFTALIIMLVLSLSSVLILTFESRDPSASIKTGGDALWWSFVTLTTVGYGDMYPVTEGGRAVAVGVMFAGVGVIGALASIIASILVPTPSELQAQLSDAADAGGAPGGAPAGAPGGAPGAGDGHADRTLVDELGLLRLEMAGVREELDRTRAAMGELRRELLTTTPTIEEHGP